MLHQLFINGPYTAGIFRKSANARVCRELREKLDSAEDEVSMEDVPVLVLSATLKVGKQKPINWPKIFYL